MFFISGCTGGDTYNTYDQNTNNNNYTQSAIPPHENAIGPEYDLAGFMFAYPALNNQNADKEFLVTIQNSQGFFETDKSYVRRIQEGFTDNLGDKIINIFEDNTIKEHATVNETRITVTFYNNAVESGTEQYRRTFRIREDMYRTNDGACVYKVVWENGLDISEIVPRQANPNEGNALFNKVLHIYCGTAQGTKTDRYYAEGWGIIAEIFQEIDGSTTYSVIDQSSYHPY